MAWILKNLILLFWKDEGSADPMMDKKRLILYFFIMIEVYRMK